VADPTSASGVELVASFFTLSGAGFTDPPRHGFVERCEAAAAAGFSGIGLHIDDLERTVSGGLDIAGMRAVLADTGLQVVEIEFLGGWALDVDDTALTATEAKIDHVAEAFRGRHVSAGEFRGGPLDRPAAAQRLAALSERRARHGLLVALEAFPWSAIPDIATAIELVRLAGASNAGLMIDVWHFFNGGAEFDDLTALPGAGVAAVQLNDGPRVHDDFLTNARATRLLPGEGDLDVVGLIGAVERTGFTGPYCVEVNTPEFRALPIAEAAKQAFATSTEVVRQARREP
jgi:sugar phosphate isomerase/epimerase